MYFMTRGHTKQVGWNQVVMGCLVSLLVWRGGQLFLECLFASFPICWLELSSRQACCRKLWRSSFSQVQVPTNMKSGSRHSIFFQSQSSDNHAVSNWMSQIGNKNQWSESGYLPRQSSCQEFEAQIFQTHIFWPSCSQKFDVNFPIGT